MKLILGTAAAAAVMLFGAPSHAADDLEPDIRCLVVGFTLAAEENPTIANAGMLLSMFFTGRLDGKLTDKQLEDRIVELTLSATDAQFASDSVACGAILERKGHAITALGERLQARAEAMGEPKS